MEEMQMDSKKDRLYIAYGSNLNLKQMERRCPTAEIVGTALLHNWSLRFRGSRTNAVATIEETKDGKVPVIIWKLQPEDENALDKYEGWPYLYRKEMLPITIAKEQVHAMVYIMNEPGNPYGVPSKRYLNTILEGYKTAGFDINILLYAALDSMKEALQHDRYY